MNKNIGDMTKEELYDLCNELLDKDTEYMLIQRRIDKAIKWVNQHISKYNCKGITIIDWDELSNPNDLLQILGDKNE